MARSKLPPYRPSPARPASQRRRWRGLALLLASLLTAGYAVLALGLAPTTINPLAPPNLAEPDTWFLDARLARLRHDRPACVRSLTPPIVTATPIADQPFQNGCGWVNAVRVTTAGAARLPVESLTCEMTAALAMWVRHAVQPAAKTHFGSHVVAIQNFGGYACRNIIGNKLWADFRSQHATANALDISAFTLADGRRVAVKTTWRGDDAAAKFLHDIHDGACRYFRAVLGPDYNAAHHDHFHFDRGYIKSCK